MVLTVVLWKDVKIVLGKNELKPLSILWQVDSRVLVFYTILGAFYQSLRISGYGSEISGHGF